MKILYANGLTNKFDQIILNGLTALGHKVFHANQSVSAEEVKVAVRQCDVALSAWADQGLASLAKLKPKRLVTYLRSYEAFAPQLLQATEWARVDRVIYVAEHVRRYAQEAHPFLADIPSSVIHNGIMPGTFSAEKDDGYLERVCFLGNLSHKKGLGLLLQAGHLLKDLGYTLDVWGEWQEPRFEQYYEAQRLPFELKGKAEVGPDFFKPYGWILSTSPWEGCPWSIIEATSAGCLPLLHNWPGAGRMFHMKPWSALQDLRDHLEVSTKNGWHADSLRAIGIAAGHFSAERMVNEIERDLVDACQTKRVVWSVPGDINHAGSRLRGYWPMDVVADEGYRVAPLYPFTDRALVGADVYVLSRSWGPAANLIIDRWHRDGGTVLFDACDLYPDAVPTINLCDRLVVNSYERGKQYEAAGVKVPIVKIPDMHDPAPFLPVAKPGRPRKVVAYHGTLTTIDQLYRVGPLPDGVDGRVYTPPGVDLPEDLLWAQHDWALATIHRELNAAYLGILPVGAHEHDAGKSANKLLTNLVAGLPTLCGDLPAYRALLEAAGHADWCVGDGHWESAIQWALNRPQEQREAMVNDCRKVMQVMFGPEVVGRMWMEALDAPRRWKGGEA